MTTGCGPTPSNPRTRRLSLPGIDRFSERGIIDNDGVEHEVDIVVFATGFKPSDYLDEVEVIGRDGVEIHDFWKGDARAYNGITVPGFPNFFLIYGPNVGGVVAGSLHFMIERAVEFSLKSVYEILQRGVSAIDVRPAALDRFVDWIDAGNRRMAWGQPYVQHVVPERARPCFASLALYERGVLADYRGGQRERSRVYCVNPMLRIPTAARCRARASPRRSDRCAGSALRDTEELIPGSVRSTRFRQAKYRLRR